MICFIASFALKAYGVYVCVLFVMYKSVSAYNECQFAWGCLISYKSRMTFKKWTLLSGGEILITKGLSIHVPCSMQAVFYVLENDCYFIMNRTCALKRQNTFLNKVLPNSYTFTFVLRTIYYWFAIYINILFYFYSFRIHYNSEDQ